MPEPLAKQVMRKIKESDVLYHRLTLIVALPGAGKTSALREVAVETGAPLVNVNLELSRRMLDLTEQQRALRLPQLLDEIVIQAENVMPEKKTGVLLDNTEILFDVRLKQDPLRLLQGLSRNHTVAVAWSGALDKEHVVYAEPGHHEYRRYPISGFLVASPEIST